MFYKKITNIEIAEQQLFHAISLYVEGTYMVSAITLAGATEEVLGKMLDDRSKTRALDEVVNRLCCMYEHIFKEPANRKDFVNLRNKAKNALKHMDKPSIELDLEKDAVQIISRAISNYKKVKSNLRIKQCKPFFEFDKIRVRRYHERCRDGEEPLP